VQAVPSVFLFSVQPPLQPPPGDGSQAGSQAGAQQAAGMHVGSLPGTPRLAASGGQQATVLQRQALSLKQPSSV
jgi:hypothetical protein